MIQMIELYHSIMAWLLITAWVLCISSLATSQSLTADTCSAEQRHLVEIEPKSDIVLGAVLDLHEAGDGVLGCGKPSPSGVLYFESLRWAIQTLNQDSGHLSGKVITESFIPGVKFGLQVYDTCGHKELSIRYMTELFPVLIDGDSECDQSEQNITKVIGMVDSTGISSNSRISDVLNKHVIPIVPLNQATTVPPEQLAKVLAEVVHDMDWERVAILHADDEYSVYVTKVFGQIAVTGHPCIAAMKSFPHTKSKDGPMLRKVISSLVNKLTDRTGIIVVGQDDSMKQVLLVIGESREFARLQWLFSWVPPTKELSTSMNAARLNTVLSLSPHPDRISEFEDYWIRLQDTTSVSRTEDHWFLEYAMSKKGCRVMGYRNPTFDNLVLCENLVMEESPTDRLLRTSRFLPVFHAVFTFAHAYKKAWMEKCLEIPGICSELRNMPRSEFVQNHLEPLEFTHLQDQRSPKDIQGQKTNSSVRGEIEGIQLALNAYSFSQSSGLNFKQVFAYDNHEARVLDENFRYFASHCPPGGCKNCIRVRQSRLGYLDNDISPSEDFITMARPEDVLIPILLPIHEAGNNPMECGNSINDEAVENLEAALWTIDQINSDPNYLHGVRLGVVAIDTCSSPLTVTQRLSNYLIDIQKTSQDEFSSSSAIIFSGSSEEFESAAVVLSPLNVTLISSTDSIRLRDVKGTYLQTAVPIEIKLKAVAETLNYVGWTFVSIVYDSNARSKELFRTFKKIAKDNHLCFATESIISSVDDIEVDYVITQILEAKDRGSKVIVMWTSEVTTGVFVKGLKRAITARIISDTEFIVICNGEWIKDLSSFKSPDGQNVGAMTFKSGQGEVTDFVTYYKRLKPDDNKRNPWFSELWHAKKACNGVNCDRNTQLQRAMASTTDIIQAVLAISAGLARLRNDICNPEPGLCPKLLQQPYIRDTFFKYLRETASSRLDEKGTMFTFTSDGYGNIPVNGYSLRRGVGNSLIYNKVATYESNKVTLLDGTIYSSMGDELSLDHVLSECVEHCTDCGQRTSDSLVLDSADHFYVAAALGVHEASANPLVCSSKVPSSAIQNVEAFLWAVDQINSSPQLLPGVELGSIVFDTCNSKEKASRDISNFLSESAVSLEKIPKTDRVMGLVAGQSDEVVESIADMTMPFQMLTVATDTSSTEFNNIEKYPSLLRISLPNDVIAEGLVDLLKHFRWNYVSVLYTDDKWRQGNLFHMFKELAERRDIELATEEKIHAKMSEFAMSAILTRLKEKKERGSSVVVLLLSTEHLSAFFAAVAKEQQHSDNRKNTQNFIWIGVNNLEVFHKYPDVSLGAVMLKPRTGTIASFRQHFEDLHLANNTRNPWFKEFWQQMLKCRGAACYKETSIAKMPLLQHPSVASVINSVLSIGVGLESLRSRICPGLESGLCPAMRTHPALREMLLDIIRTSSFMGIDGRLFKFTGRNYAAGTLDLFNFIQVGSNARAFVEVGKFSPDEGLSVNYSKVKAYNEDNREFSLYDVKSVCKNKQLCHSADSKKDTSAMLMIPREEFAISALMPLHQQGQTFFECGELRNGEMFQNLVAVAYAVDKVNRNDSLLPSLHLGAIVFDFCGRKQRAEEQLYGFFSTDHSHPQSEKLKIPPKSIIASLTFGEDVAENVAPILDASNVIQVAAPSSELDFGESRGIIRTIPSALIQIQVLLSVLERLHLRYVNLIYSNTDYGRAGYYEFTKGAKQDGICLASILMVEPNSDTASIAYHFQTEKFDANVIVLLVNDADLINTTIEAAKRTFMFSKFLWISGDGWGTKAGLAENLQDSVANVISIEVESQEEPEFIEYFLNQTPRRHEPIPDSWFDEWWQHLFRCRLRDSLLPQIQYSNICSGKERLDANHFLQDKYVYHTIKVVETIAKGLHKYLVEKCPHGMAALMIDDCGAGARSEVHKEIETLLSGEDPDCEECGSPGTMFGYEVYQLSNDAVVNKVYKKIGTWKDGILSLDEDRIHFVMPNDPQSTCKTNCAHCMDQLGKPETLSDSRESIFHNFEETWGIAVSAITLLGIVLVLICALYFLMSFPVTVGTTVLGYMILFGLLLLYAVNFAFIISPTECTCGVRRFGLGLAYAVIFSGMLVKVMNTWRLMGYNGSRMLNDGTRLSSPAGLLVIAVGLVIIQIVLSAAWLILMPPKIGAYEMVWRCAPPTTFEEGLVVSLVYVMLLLAITTLFSILTWQCQDNNKESRWILACSTLVAVVWLAWTVLSTQMSPHNRDFTIAVANLVNATIIMGCLYLRKVYIYSKLTRQAKDQDMKAHLQPAGYTHSVYGTSQKSGVGGGGGGAGSGPFATLSPVLYGSQASLNCKKLYNGGPSSRLELINCPEDNKSDSSGSVQVQAADLYPLEMYDGGSQFQPMSSLFGSNHTLVLDDTLTFGR